MQGVSLVSPGVALPALPRRCDGERTRFLRGQAVLFFTLRSSKVVFPPSVPESFLLLLLSFLVFAYSPLSSFSCSFSPCRDTVLLRCLLALHGYYFLPCPGLLQKIKMFALDHFQWLGEVVCEGVCPTLILWISKNTEVSLISKSDMWRIPLWNRRRVAGFLFVCLFGNVDLLVTSLITSIIILYY